MPTDTGCALFAAGRCRSCSEIAVGYAEQLSAKHAAVRQALSAWPDLDWHPAHASPAFGFRNKAKMVVGGQVEAPVLGILDGAGTIDLTACPLYPPALAASFGPLTEFITRARIPPYDVGARRGELKYLLITLAAHSGELMVRFVLRSQEALGRLRRELPWLLAALPGLRVVSVNLQPEHKAILEGDTEIVLGPDDRLRMELNGLPLFLRPKSFFQTNDHVAAALYRQAAEWVEEAAPASVWDLFCGVGGFALHVAAPARDTVGIEREAEAIASAEASRAAIDAPRLRFISLDATDFARGGSFPELVIVNPPRRGLGEALCAMLDAAPSRWLLYSSCNVDSLARDLAAMPAFMPRRARLFDMFPHTRHHEVLMLAERAPGLAATPPPT